MILHSVTPKFRILHVSDLHIPAYKKDAKDISPENIEVTEILESLFDAITKIDPRPDFLVITGDIIDRGNQTEIEYACQVIGDAYDKIFGKGLVRERLIMCPGNHDVHRENLKNAFNKAESIQKFDTLVTEENLTNIDDEYVYKPFENYNRLCEQLKCKKPTLSSSTFESAGYVFGEVLNNDYGIRFRILNSSWLCLGNDYYEAIGKQDPTTYDKMDAEFNSFGRPIPDPDYGGLILGKNLINKLPKKKDANDYYFNVALIHHPSPWLRWDERDAPGVNVIEDLPNYERICTISDLILSGHEHSVMVNNLHQYKDACFINYCGAGRTSSLDKYTYYPCSFSVLDVARFKPSTITKEVYLLYKSPGGSIQFRKESYEHTVAYKDALQSFGINNDIELDIFILDLIRKQSDFQAFIKSSSCEKDFFYYLLKQYCKTQFSIDIQDGDIESLGEDEGMMICKTTPVFNVSTETNLPDIICAKLTIDLDLADKIEIKTILAAQISHVINLVLEQPRQPNKILRVFFSVPELWLLNRSEITKRQLEIESVLSTIFDTLEVKIPQLEGNTPLEGKKMPLKNLLVLDDSVEIVKYLYMVGAGDIVEHFRKDFNDKKKTKKVVAI